MKKLTRIKSEIGQGFVEYSLILVSVAIVAAAALELTGITLQETYCKVLTGLGGEDCGCTFSFDDYSEFEDWEGEGKEDIISIENGNACFSGDGKKVSKVLNSCTEDFGTSDFVINVNSVTIEKSNGKKATGFDVMFRSEDEKNGYHFTYNAKNNKVQFWKRVKGKNIRLSSTKVPKEWANEEISFLIVVVGDSFTAYKDGEPVLQASDSAYAEGKVGVRNKPSSKTCFDNISVETLSQ